MNKILISFLGKVRDNKAYQTATYHFSPPDSGQHTTPFFGLAALKATGSDTLRVLGTSGSMWHMFLQEFFPEDVRDAQAQALFTAVFDAVNEDRMTQAQLDTLADKLNCPKKQFQFYLIPYGDTESEQVEILKAITDGISPHQEVCLDLTHGLRHLPMLGLLAALYLRAATQTKLSGIYYGALERTKEGVTPVIRLDGLLLIYDGIRSLEQFNKDGDYSTFQESGVSEGFPTRLLQEAAFFERIASTSESRDKLNDAMEALDKAEADQRLNPATSLFTPLLRDRTAWRKEADRGAREWALAKDYLDRKDYLRAVLFGLEASMTDEALRGGADAENRQSREKAKERLFKSKDFRQLNNLRNALAHGEAEDIYQENKFRMLKESEMHAWLSEVFERLDRRNAHASQKQESQKNESNPHAKKSHSKGSHRQDKWK